MRKTLKRTLTSAMAISVSLGLASCGGIPTENRTLNSARQPIVERSNFTLDVIAAPDGLPVSEQQRVAGWFEAMDLRYGDRVSLDEGTGNPAIREDVAALASRYGILVSDGSPLTEGFVEPGQARIVVTRSSAHVPGCPDWSANADINPLNATYPGYGCAVNSNMAAMIADPEDLLAGKQGTGETVVTTSNKAIESYRGAPPSGAGNLPTVSSTEGG